MNLTNTLAKNVNLHSRSLLFFIFFQILFSQAFSQIDVESLDADSLLQELSRTVNPSDKSYLNIVLANAWLNEDTEKAREYANEGKRLMAKLQDNHLTVNYHMVVGRTYFLDSELDKAEQHFDSALMVVVNTDLQLEKSMVYLNLANLAEKRSKNQLALHYLEKSRSIKEKLDDLSGLSKVYMTMGNIYYIQGEYDQSAEWYLKALKIMRESGDELAVAKTINNIGNIYMVTGNYPKAMEYYRQGLTLREKLEDRKGISVIYNNFGSVYYSTQQFDSAIFYFQKSLEIKKEFNDLYSIAGTLSNIGSIHRVLKNFPEASRYYNEALAIREQLGNNFELASAYFNMGEFFLDQGKRTEALRFFSKSQVLAEEHGFLRVQVALYRRLSQMYESQGDFKRALDYHQKYVQARENEFKESYQKSLEQIEQYKIEEQQQINDLLKKETEIQSLQIDHDRVRRMTMTIFFTAAVILLVFLLLMFILRYRRKSRINKELLEINNEILRLKESAKKAGEEFERILSNISDLIFSVTYHPETGFSDIYFSPAVYDITGYRPEEIEAEPEIWETIIHPHDKEVFAWERFKKAVISDGEENISEFRVKHKNGTVHWLQQKVRFYPAENGAFRIDGVSRNITERKEIENALKSSEYLYRSTIDSLTDHHIHVIDETYTIKIFNKAFRHLNDKLGLDTEVVGRKLFDIYKFLGDGIRDEYSSVFETGRSVVTQDSMVISGSEMITETYKVPVLRNGQVKKVITIMKDITEDVKTREALEFSEAKYREASISKDKFFSVIAHDLMSPFNALLGFSGLLHDLYDEYTDQERKAQAGRILELSELIYKMAENLLFWSRSQTGRINVQTEWIDIKAMLQQQIDISMPHALKKQITLSCNINGEMRMFSDPNLLSIILRNLITNAVKFTAHGGKVDISAGVKDGRVEIVVKDNGIGIPDEIAEKLWTPGTQVKRPGTDREIGTGLGLMISKEFVDLMQGTIEVKSCLGKGSSFIISLPDNNGDMIADLSSGESDSIDEAHL